MTRNILLSTAGLAFAGALAFAPVPVHAANVDHPYSNVDRHNDAGNNTGDSQVDKLNEQQLDQNYWPRHMPMASAQPTYQSAPVYDPPPAPRPNGY